MFYWILKNRKKKVKCKYYNIKKFFEYNFFEKLYTHSPVKELYTLLDREEAKFYYEIG